MSRLGKKPIDVPTNVNVEISGRTVKVSSGSNTLSMDHRPEVSVDWAPDDKQIRISIKPEDEVSREVRAYWGLTRSLIANMVEGVTKGYAKTLEVVGVGYTAAINGANIDLKVGFANTIKVPIPMGVDVQVERNMIRIKGIDKQAVGQFAANVRAVRKPEPYNGKGIKYAEERVRRKQGKVTA